MSALLTAIVLWLSANFGLPAVYDFPRIERISSTEMAEVFYRSVPADLHAKMSIDDMQPVFSLYNNETRTIYLRSDWTGRTAADLSLLVHEMVHHLQNLSAPTFQCPLAREKLAHEAQERWLNMFGRSLLSEFGIDKLSILMSTSCPE